MNVDTIISESFKNETKTHLWFKTFPLTWNSIRRKLSSRQHDVSEVERRAVHSTEILIRVTSGVEMLQGRLQPAQTRQIAPGQDVDVGKVGLDLTRHGQREMSEGTPATVFLDVLNKILCDELGEFLRGRLSS